MTSSNSPRAVPQANPSTVAHPDLSLFHSMVEHSPIATAIHCEGVIVYINQAAIKLLGGETAVDFLGKSALTFVYPEDISMGTPRIRQVLRGEMQWGQYERFVRLDQRIIDVEIISSPITYQQKPAAYIVFWDVTERKWAERLISRYARELSMLYEISLDINAQPDLHSLLHTILEQAAHLLAAQSGSLYLMQPEQNSLLLAAQLNMPKSDLERLEPLGQGVADWVQQTSEPFIVMNDADWATHRDVPDTFHPQRILGVPLKQGNSCLGVLMVFDLHQTRPFDDEDVQLLELFAAQASIAIQNVQLRSEVEAHNSTLESRIAQRTQELMLANQQLQVLDKMRAKLISDITHELRTPIASLSLYLDLLEKGSDEKRPHYTQVLRTQTNRLNSLVEAIVSYSQFDPVTAQTTFVQLDLVTLIVTAVAHLQPRFTEKKLAVQTDLPASPVYFVGSANLLTTMLNRLLENALLYTEVGTVSITVMTDPQEVQIEIRDTGIGIEQEDLPNLFERFYRGQNIAQLNIPGIGLGLALVQEIVLLHNGRIEVSSTPAKGSAFTIFLPNMESRTKGEGAGSVIGDR